MIECLLRHPEAFFSPSARGNIKHDAHQMIRLAVLVGNHPYTVLQPYLAAILRQHAIFQTVLFQVCDLRYRIADQPFAVIGMHVGRPEIRRCGPLRQFVAQ